MTESDAALAELRELMNEDKWTEGVVVPVRIYEALPGLLDTIESLFTDTVAGKRPLLISRKEEAEAA